jgi:hypothetical protein
MQASRAGSALADIPVATENLVRLQIPTESANDAIIPDTQDWSGDLERLQQFWTSSSPAVSAS